MGLYAGDAAQEGDTLGLPSYALFKKHALFNTTIADFGVDLRQLQRLLAECGYGLGAGGMGLGDLTILFNSLAQRHKVLGFEAVLQLCRTLRPRLAHVHAMIAAGADEAGDPLRPRTATDPPGSGGSLWATTRAASGASASGGASGHGGSGSGGLGGLQPRAGGLLQRCPSSTPLGFAAAMAVGHERNGGLDGPRSPRGGAAGRRAAGPGGASARQNASPEREASVASLLPSPYSGRPSSASRLPGAYTAHHRASAAAAAASASAAAAGTRPSTSGRGATGVPHGLSSLMALKEPPILLREHLPPPPCAFPAIAARISGIQVLYRDGEMTRVALALRDLQSDWESAVASAALSAALRKQAAGGPGGGSQSIGGGEPLRMERAEIPLASRIWLLLLHGCCLLLEGKHRSARKSLQAAESLFNPNVLGLEHPYHYCILLCFGILSWYEQKFEAAIEHFEAARELCDLVSRGTFDVTARRNAAACLNNLGACHLVLGHRSEAVASFRAAYELVRAATGVPEVPEAVVALRNLNKALKQGFALNTARLRPTSAPPMYSQVGSTAVPRDQKLQTFLQSAVVMRVQAPLTELPVRCTKVTADDIIAQKKAKEAAAKQKAKSSGDKPGKGDKPRPKPKAAAPFAAMPAFPFPSYGVANVSLEAKKKKGRKAAAK